MKNVGSSKTDFKLSEFEPPTEWGHTAYITVTPDKPLLVRTLDSKLEKVHFNIHHRLPRVH